MTIQRNRSWGRIKPLIGYRLNFSDPLSVGLIGRWLFNGSGGRPRNLVTNAAFTSLQSVWTVGAFGSCRSYSGASTDQDPTPSPTGDRSVSFWVRPSNLFGFQRVFFTSGNEWSVFFSSTQLAQLSNGNTEYNSPFSRGFSNGVLVHAVVVKSLSSSSVVAYFNGVKDASVITSSENPAAAASCQFGSSIASQYLYGTLDNIALYKRALTATEARRLYAEPFAGVETISCIVRSVFLPSTSGVLSGTIASGINEGDVVTGGKTIILILIGDTWIAAGALSFDLQRQNIINGLTSAQSETFGWNNVVKALQGVSGVVRTSDTIVTITLDAEITYDITATETITATIPGTALSSGNALVAVPTFTVAATAVAGGPLPWAWRRQQYPIMAPRAGGVR